MDSIVIFYKPNLDVELQATLKSLSDVGIAEFIDSGVINIYSRLCNIELADLQAIPEFTAWTHSAQLADEPQADYIGRITTEIVAACNDLKLDNIQAIWMNETIYNQVSKQPEFMVL